MPHTSGVRFYRWLKESPEMRDIPVIIVTGISDDFKRFISTRREVPPPEGYLSKPIEEESLLMLVRALCDRGGSP
jgi:response regulator RpfG family c-di-GMP phosphodiesterase